MLVAKRKHAYAVEPWRYPNWEEKPRKVVRKKARVLQKYAQVALVMFVFSVAVSVLAHYSMLLGISYQTGRLRKEITALKSEQYHLQLEAAGLNSLDRIESIALEELGLIYPAENQHIILTLKR